MLGEPITRAARRVRSRIREREWHHAKRSFRDEYVRFLKKYEIEHDEGYLLKPLEGACETP